MVDRVLTSDEREILLNATRFQKQVIWALRNFASYWNDSSDANTKVGQVGYTTWAKNWIYSARILANPGLINLSTIYVDYMILSKGMNLWDTAVTPFDVDTVIDYMVANGKFDELTSTYVTDKTLSPSSL